MELKFDRPVRDTDDPFAVSAIDKPQAGCLRQAFCSALRSEGGQDHLRVGFDEAAQLVKAALIAFARARRVRRPRIFR